MNDLGKLIAAAPLEVWEAHAEHDIGTFISTYLRQHPPPCESELSSDLRASSRWFLEAACADLALLGERRLRAVRREA